MPAAVVEGLYSRHFTTVVGEHDFMVVTISIAAKVEPLVGDAAWPRVRVTKPLRRGCSESSPDYNLALFMTESQCRRKPLTPQECVVKWLDAFNAADTDRLTDLYSENAINHQVAEQPVEGRAAIRAMFARDFAAAEMVCIPEQILADGECSPRAYEARGLRGRRLGAQFQDIAKWHV